MAFLTDKPLDAAALEAKAMAPSCGASVSFAGVVRDEHEGKKVLRIEYEAAPDLALAAMEEIEREARKRFPVHCVLIAHRTGTLEVGEASVVICASAAHRGAAFDACRWAIDTLKETVPIWKKEHFASGEAAWVKGNPLRAVGET